MSSVIVLSMVLKVSRVVPKWLMAFFGCEGRGLWNLLDAVNR
jgi:hypothetical protein